MIKTKADIRKEGRKEKKNADKGEGDCCLLYLKGPDVTFLQL
jgi:hypothetical protein